MRRPPKGSCAGSGSRYPPWRRHAGSTRGRSSSPQTSPAQTELTDHVLFQSQLLEAVEQAVIATDERGCVIFWNKAAHGLFGWSKDEALGKSVLDIIVAADFAEHAREVMGRLASGTPWSGEFRVRRKDGTPFVAQVAGSPRLDDEGRFAGFVGMATDVTERRRAQDALAKSEARFRSLVEALPIGIIVYDDEAITYANPALAHLTESGNPADLVGHDIFDFIHPDSAATVRGRMDAYAEGHPRPPAEILVRVPGEEPRSVEVNTIPFEYEGRTSMLSAVVDVTERNRAQAALREAQERLHETQKLEAIGQLAGGIAHDFNNLLQAILGNVDSLQNSIGGDADSLRDLDAIRGAAERAADMNRKLLAYSRKQAVRPRVFRPDLLIANMTNLLRAAVGEGIEIHVNPSSEGAVEADPAQVEQAILNLALNARDAMPDGGTLTMSVRDTVDAGDTTIEEGHATAMTEEPLAHVVELTVTDTGIGMDDHTVRHMFEPFFTTKDTNHNSGLGLATSHGIVTHFGGSMRAESALGRGTTVTLTLPRTDKPVDWCPQDDTEVCDELTGKETILVVEDESAVRSVIVRSLEKYGYEVISAADAHEALEVMGDDPGETVDLLLSDVVLPGMSGYQLARHLSDDPRFELPVLYMSGYSADALPDTALSEEGTAPLEKPFTSDVLARTVRDLLDG